MTRRIPVGPFPHFYAIVDDEDFDELSKFSWEADSRSRTVYAKRNRRQTPKGQSKLLHKILTGFVQTDHINGIGLDNRRENLREATNSQNQSNRPKQRGTHSSCFKGVDFAKSHDRWRARIMIDGKRLLIGYYHSDEEAAHAYDVKAVELFGEFAHPNF